MCCLKWIYFVAIFFVINNEVFTADFGYNGCQGPKFWAEKYITCDGKFQSPIDISDESVQPATYDDLHFKNFNETPDKTILVNNGYTVMLKMHTEKNPEVSGGPLSGVYRFEQLHFHWGRNDTQGSETTINGVRFPLEMHIVFYKKEYKCFAKALQFSDGLTVLSFLYKVSSNDNTNYDDILSVISQVEDPNTSIKITKPNPINNLLLKETDRNDYYTYSGSLTTPPCSEVVIWIQFKQLIEISSTQLKLFRNLNNDDGKLTDNFRPTQPLNDRIIYYNSKDNVIDYTDDTSESSSNINTYPIGIQTHAHDLAVQKASRLTAEDKFDFSFSFLFDVPKKHK